MDRPKIAIVGSGVTGAAVAFELSRTIDATVVVYDQGRGLGGRAGHRRVRAADGAVVAPDPTPPAERVFAFDHGCQFFRTDSARFRSVAETVLAPAGAVVKWKGRFGRCASAAAPAPPPTPPPTSRATSAYFAAMATRRLGAPTRAAAPSRSTADSFFGFPGRPPFWVPVGGMHALPKALLAEATTGAAAAAARAADETIRSELRQGVRVAHIEPSCDDSGGARPGWVLRGPSGAAAYHDTPEALAGCADRRPRLHGTPGGVRDPLLDAIQSFDAVVVTDVSAATSGAWHRAAANVPERVARRAKALGRARVPLMTALVAFDAPLDLRGEAADMGPDDAASCGNATGARRARLVGPSFIAAVTRRVRAM